MAEDTVSRDEFNELKNSLSQVSEQFQATSGKAHNYGVQMDLVKKTQQRLVNIWQGSVFGKAQMVGKWFGNLSKVVTKYSDDSEDMAEANNNLTTIQKKLIAPLVKGTGAAKLGQGMWKKYRHTIVKADGSIRVFRAAFLMLSSVMLTIVGILGILGFAFAIFSLATEGASSPVMDLVEQHLPFLKDAFHGLINLLQGDLTASWQNLKGFLLLVGAAFLLLPGTLAPFIVGIMLAVAAFRKFKESGMSTGKALTLAVGLAGAAVWVILSFLTPAKVGRFLFRLLKHVLKFIGLGGVLILAGLAGLWAAASGKLSKKMSVVVAVISGLALWLGMTLVSTAIGTSTAIGSAFAMIPFFWVAAILVILAIAIRFKPQLLKIFKSIAKDIINLFIWAANLAIDILLIPFNLLIAGLNKIPGVNIGYVGVGDTIPMLADGGPVRAGRSYIVGERGPELFTAGSSGRITPNHEMGGGTSNITMNIDVGGVTDQTDKRALARQIGDALNQELRRLGGNPTRGRY